MEPEQAQFLFSVISPNLKSEHEATVKTFKAVPEDKKDFRPDPKAKSAFELAWHMVTSEKFFSKCLCNGSFDFDANTEGGDAIPESIESMADVIDAYEKNHEEMMGSLDALSADDLARTISFANVWNLPAVSYINFMMFHNIHHRGQLSTYLRPMGSKNPSIYGGSADEPFKPPTE